MRMGCPLEGVGGMKWLRTVPDASQRGPREVKRQPPTILNPLVATLKRLKKRQLKLILIMFIQSNKSQTLWFQHKINIFKNYA